MNNPQLYETYSQLNDQIEVGGQNLQQLFAKREDELLKLYKKEMLSIQRQLKELSEESSETEIRRKIQEHREELERERTEFQQKSIHLTAELKKLSKLEKQVKSNQEELLSEIKFLDEQLIYADKHNLILKEELESLSEDQIRFSQPPTKSNRFQQSYNIHLPKLQQEQVKNEISKQKQVNQELRSKVYIQEQPENLEQCFDDAVGSINQTYQQESDSSTMIDLTCCNDFSDIQKRKIFEAFLQKPYVKKVIYELLTKK